VNKVSAILRGFNIEHRMQPTSPANAPRGKIPFLKHTHADMNDPTRHVLVSDSAMIVRYLVNTFGKPSASGCPTKVRLLILMIAVQSSVLTAKFSVVSSVISARYVQPWLYTPRRLDACWWPRGVAWVCLHLPPAAASPAPAVTW